MKRLLQEQGIIPIIALIAILAVAGIGAVLYEQEVSKLPQLETQAGPTTSPGFEEAVLPTPSPTLPLLSSSPVTHTVSPVLSMKPLPTKLVLPEPSQITVTLSGKVYSDTNCNVERNSDEPGIQGVQVTIIRLPEFIPVSTLTTDTNGDYRFVKTIGRAETLSLQPSALSKEGYKGAWKFDPDYGKVTLSATNPTATVDLAQTPYEFYNSCPQDIR